MPSKKKKYNARFPAGRIKKIMQTDEEVGKVAQAVPVIISRTLELFVESLLTKSMQITQARNAKTLTPSHMKQCILSESRFDFLKDLVKNIPDASTQEDNENNGNEAVDYSISKTANETEIVEQSTEEVVANFYTEQSTSATRTPVIQYGRNQVSNTNTEPPKLNFSVDKLVNRSSEQRIHIDLSSIPNMTPATQLPLSQPISSKSTTIVKDDVPQLIPISHTNFYNSQNTGGDNLLIDEDYDN